jgi:hypothetical protein
MYLHTGSLTVSTFFYSSIFPTLTFIHEEKNVKHEKRENTENLPAEVAFKMSFLKRKY